MYFHKSVKYFQDMLYTISSRLMNLFRINMDFQVLLQIKPVITVSISSEQKQRALSN